MDWVPSGQAEYKREAQANSTAWDDAYEKLDKFPFPTNGKGYGNS